jgi:PIN domain nuclease of toxin-antitoxin system
MTALLLDTHAFIWYSEGDANLPDSLKTAIDSADRVYLSIATLWEIAIKINLDKLSLQANYELIEASLEPAGIDLLPIAFADTVQFLKLPLYHRDPFDRILIAQAMRHDLILVSRDSAFAAYPVQQLWA